jgi:transcriptional regulator with XRE-family HTH domain
VVRRPADVGHRRAFGDSVRSHRQRLGISQEALAELSGLHRTYVSSVERGQRNVGLDNVYILAKALQTTVVELFTEADRSTR